jgi:hypothetical protein
MAGTVAFQWVVKASGQTPRHFHHGCINGTQFAFVNQHFPAFSLECVDADQNPAALPKPGNERPAKSGGAGGDRHCVLPN